MANDRQADFHPSDGELVAYLGRELEGEALRRVEDHLSRCAECRAEVVDAQEVLGGERSGRRARWPIAMPLAAAAAVAALFLSGLPDGRSPVQPIHRAVPTAVESAPGPVSPVGSVDAVEAFVWTRRVGADRYRLTVFAPDGSVTFTAVTTDSVENLPDSVQFEPDQAYLWRVEARVGWDVWQASGLTEFQVGGGGG